MVTAATMGLDVAYRAKLAKILHVPRGNVFQLGTPEKGGVWPIWDPVASKTV